MKRTAESRLEEYFNDSNLDIIISIRLNRIINSGKLYFIFSSINAVAMNSSNTGGNGGSELFEKFQRQKLNRETSVNAGVLTDT